MAHKSPRGAACTTALDSQTPLPTASAQQAEQTSEVVLENFAVQGRSVRLKQVFQASAVLPIALMALFIATQGINMPYLDEYAITAPIAVATAEGVLQPSYFFQQESNHRLVFTKLTTAVNTLLTGWDLRVEMWANFALILASFMLLCTAWRQVHPPTAAWLILPFALVLFAIRQRPNFALYIGSYWGQFFTFAALYILVRMAVSLRTLLYLALCVVGATFSNAGGISLWFALLPALWLRGYRQRSLVLWLLIASLIIGAFFLNYNFNVRFSGVENPVVPLHLYLLYILAFLGSPLVVEANGIYPTSILCFSAGVVILIFNLRFLLRKKAPLSIFALPIALLLMALGNAVIAAAGRADIMYYVYDGQPLSARYVTAANWFWLAVLMVSAVAIWQAQQARRHPTLKYNRAALVGFASISLIVNVTSWNISNDYYPLTLTERDRECMLNYMSAPDAPCLNRFYPPEWRMTDIRYIAKHRLTAFRDWYAGREPASDLTRAPLQYLNGTPGAAPAFVREMRDGAAQTALRLSVPSVVEQYVQLPDASRVFFEADIMTDAAQPAKLSLSVRIGRTIIPVASSAISAAGAQIVAELSQWGGQAVLLVYEVTSDASEATAQRVWLWQPRLSVTG
ncbi:MAG: hypothetical protein J7551_09610 [Chloroflexi bacterium]|nr:hypothetical protein [Chloroflexota bacterium]